MLNILHANNMLCACVSVHAACAHSLCALGWDHRADRDLASPRRPVPTCGHTAGSFTVYISDHSDYCFWSKHQNLMLVFITFDRWICKPPRSTIQLFRRTWDYWGCIILRQLASWSAGWAVSLQKKCHDTACFVGCPCAHTFKTKRL